MTDASDGRDAPQEDDDYEEFPEPRRRHRALTVFLVLLVGLLVAVGLGVRWVDRQIHPPGPVGGQVVVTPSWLHDATAHSAQATAESSTNLTELA